MDDFMQSIIAFATTYGIRIVGAVAVLIAGRIAAGLVRGSVQRVLSKRGTDPMLINFASVPS
jgi:hypothetical protein